MWSPVVYGRTRHVDAWWRALPSGLDPAAGSWVARGVRAAVQGGHDLRHGPRFLIARERDATLVGVACRAGSLSGTMHSDGARDLYCFVGWVGDGPAVPLAELVSHHVGWAGAEYERWVSLDWDAPPAEDGAPHVTRATAPPWPPTVADLARSASPLVVDGGGPEIWPPSAAEELWACASATPDSSLVVVVGVRAPRAGRLAGVTHATVDGTSARYVMTGPPAVPVRPDISAAAGPVPPGAGAHRGRGLLRWLGRCRRG